MTFLKMSKFLGLEQCEKLACLNSTSGERGEEQGMKEKHGNYKKMLVIHICTRHQGSFLDRQEAGLKQALLKHIWHTMVHFLLLIIHTIEVSISLHRHQNKSTVTPLQTHYLVNMDFMLGPLFPGWHACWKLSMSWRKTKHTIAWIHFTTARGSLKMSCIDPETIDNRFRKLWYL